MSSFTITANANAINTTAVGPVPGGYRIQVDYGPGVELAGTDADGCTIRGHVVTGSDWLILRDDGVVLFDAKITFEATIESKNSRKPLPGKHLFDAVISGRSDIHDKDWKPIRKRDDLNTLPSTIRMALPIQFESSEEAPAGASQVIQRAAQHFAHFGDLAKSQFVARGEMKVRAGAIVGLSLSVSAMANTASMTTGTAASETAGSAARSQRVLKAHHPLVGLILAVESEIMWNAVREALVSPVVDHIKAEIARRFPGFDARIDSLPGSNWAEAEVILAPIKNQYDAVVANEPVAARKAGK